MKTNYWFNRNRFLSGLRFIALLLACSAIAQSAIAVTPSFPLKKSANGHYLTDQNDVPFFMVSDTVWDFVNEATNADIDTFLADRAARGFNAVMVEMVDCHYATNAPNNINNVAPYTTPGNFSTYNPAYFDRFDFLVDQANSYGIVVIAFPIYLGYNCGNDGCGDWVRSDTTAHIQSFMTYIGNRYKNKGNIIWAMGGDANPFNCSLDAKVDAAAQSLVAADPNHLVTFHSSRNNEGVDPWISRGTPSWLTLNSNYTDKFTYSQGQAAYNRTPARPFFLLETYYENDPHIASFKELRSEAYWSILAGNCGYTFGNCPLWGLASPVTLSRCRANSDWRLQLNTTGSNDVTRFKNFFTSTPWQTLVPDFNHTVVTGGYGSGTTTVTTARASDGSFVISYLPVVTGIAVDMTRLTGSSLTARWYDPTNGTYTNVAGSPFSNTGTRVFTPTGNNSSGASDWVLLLQSSTSPPSSGWNLITTADFNRNGNPDFVLQNGSTRRTAIWYLNNNVYVGGAYGPTLPSGWQLVEKTHDFNGDGKPDYVLYKTSTRQTAIWYLNNNVFLGGAYGPTLPGRWMLTGTGDFNGDNKPDYVLYNASTHQTAVWYMNNNVFAGGVFGPTLPAGWSLAGVADFNRDGKRDYLLFNASTRQTAIWYLSGVTFTGGLFGPSLPGGWQLVEAADFNGDGKPDYLLHNPSTRQTAIWYLNNNIFLAGAYGPTIP